MKIEKVTIEDAKELLNIYAPYVKETAISFEYEVPSEEEFADRIKRISSKYPYIKAVENGKILGYAYANTFIARAAYDWSVETAIYLRQDTKGQGIGRSLYQHLEKSLKDMGILNMNACIAVPIEEDIHLSNDSYHFHKRMGFELVGTFHKSGYKFEKWYDMIWMEKMLGQHNEKAQRVKFGKWDIL